MVIIIVLNLIFGVIIDTFADLRSEKQKKEEILKTTCFICGERGVAGAATQLGLCPGPARRGTWALCERPITPHVDLASPGSAATGSSCPELWVLPPTSLASRHPSCFCQLPPFLLFLRFFFFT